MNQVQELRVAWRPDLYRHNPELLSLDFYRKKLDAGTFFVAETEGKVVGVMDLEYRHVESPSQLTRNVIYIDTMAVEESYRGMGVGHAFFDRVKRLKREKSFDGIELQVNAGNAAAYEMYRKYGFTEKSIHMELL